MLEEGQQRENRHGTFNQWVIDNLVEDDVVVVDLFDKIVNGTFVGGNLSTAIASRTRNGGAVIWGGIRDYEQIVKIEIFNVSFAASIRMVSARLLWLASIFRAVLVRPPVCRET